MANDHLPRPHAREKGDWLRAQAPWRRRHNRLARCLYPFPHARPNNFVTYVNGHSAKLGLPGAVMDPNDTAAARLIRR